MARWMTRAMEMPPAKTVYLQLKTGRETMTTTILTEYL